VILDNSHGFDFDRMPHLHLMPILPFRGRLKAMINVFWVLTLILLICALLPLWRHEAWWVRGLDFPRLQLFMPAAGSYAGRSITCFTAVISAFPQYAGCRASDRITLRF
jgi:hypothetical protein